MGMEKAASGERWIAELELDARALEDELGGGDGRIYSVVGLTHAGAVELSGRHNHMEMDINWGVLDQICI
jgi:hypothetical protein